MGLIPGPGRSLARGNGNSLKYSCLGNPMDRTERLSTHTHTLYLNFLKRKKKIHWSKNKTGLGKYLVRERETLKIESTVKSQNTNCIHGMISNIQ